jgi:excisionase family DNA binding protein
MPDEVKYPIRVSVSEAARLFGVDPHTIRRAVKAQELRYIVVQGRYKINFDSLVTWSQSRITVKKKMEQKGIGQYVDHWKIKTKKFSPDSKLIAERAVPAGRQGSQSAELGAQNAELKTQNAEPPAGRAS